MNNPDENTLPQRPDRPLGVTVLSIWDGVTYGLLPALRMGITIAGNQNLEEISFLTLCLSIGIPITIVMAAFGTFQGNDRSRISLLILLTIYFGLNSFQDVVLLISGGVTAEDQIRTSLGIIGAVIAVSVNIWYFLRPSTIAFFRRPSPSQE